ncbi:MAG: DNA polymerase I [Dehalococcoidales bacterium]|nr:DNA polymerase I [Dehalococcoidales bacterium]
MTMFMFNFVPLYFLCYNKGVKKPVFVVFDGNAIIHRAFHAIPPFTVRKTGEMVGAVYGFASILMKVINDLQPTHYAIAFDKKAPTFRHKLDEQYKATRPETPSELAGQFGRVRQMVDVFKIPVYEMEGFEADDLLGTLSRQATGQNMDTIIVTGDADAMQLVNDRVKVFYPRPRGNFSDADLYDDAAVVNKYGIKPEHISDYKALKGDASDNIPGVRGIGEKTAVKLIQQFGSLDEIYRRLDEVKPEKLQALLRTNESEARRCKVLSTIVTDVPVKLNLSEAETSHFDRQKAIDLFRELEFTSLVNKMPQGEPAALQPSLPVETVSAPPHTYKIINTIESLNELVHRLQAATWFTFDTETSSLNPLQSDLVGISLSSLPGEAYYIPLGHIGLSTTPQLPLETVVEKLKPVFAGNQPKIAHNGKFDIEALSTVGIEVHNFTFDTMIAGFLLNEAALGLKALAMSRLNIEMKQITDLIGTGAKQIPMSQVDIETAADYAAADADMTGRLYEVFQKELQVQNLWQLFDETEMPLVPVLVHMERAGILVNRTILDRMSATFGEKIKVLEAEICRHAGEVFNINSTQQLSGILFDKLQLQPPKKKAGSYSTAAGVLEDLKGDHPIIQDILNYRGLAKLKSTYVDALPELINPRTGRIHTCYSQTRAITGRLSSSDPNLQNIPIKDEQGRLIRTAFVAPAGSYFFAADYSQIDLRALAHLSQDDALLSAFNNDEDIHTATASQIYGVPPEQVTPQMRRFAKTINFGVIYGMSEFGLQQATELSREEAGKFIKAYFEKYSGVKWYMELTKEQARHSGYVQTILGRKRMIPEIRASNRQIRESAERMAINMPVQGTSADIIKKAMINIYREMLTRKLKTKMLLQVHDELVFEVPEDELETIKTFVPEMMVNAIQLSIPLKVDTKIGVNWGEMEK